MNTNEFNKVEISGNSFTSSHIEECINKLLIIQQEKYNNVQFQIIANKCIIHFDFTLIGHLILFKKSIEKIDFIIHLPFNEQRSNNLETVNEKKGRGVIWKLKQYMAHSYYSTGINIFTLIDASGDISLIDKKKIQWFALSEKFLPIIFINHMSFEKVFQAQQSFLTLNSIKIQIIHKDKKIDKEELLYQACRNLLFRKRTTENYLTILSQLAFYRSLQAARILRYYLYEQLSLENREKLEMPENKDELKIVNIENLTALKEYRRVVINIFNDLHPRPPIYHFMFFTLISTEIVGRFLKIELTTQAKKLFNLWEFTKELVYGSTELAKNIIQHSSTHEGIITGYINEKRDFELTIFDHGKKSIVTTLLEYTEEKVNKSENNLLLQQLYKADLTTLTNSTFHFSNLFTIDHKNILNQQSKRATAHIGLLLFSKLIEENRGKLIVSSKDVNNGKNYFYSNCEFGNNLTQIGTCFKTVLSIDKDINYHPYKKISTPISGNKSDITSVVKLMDYKLFEYDKPHLNIPFETRINLILNIRIPSFDDDLYFADEKMWDYFFQLFDHSLVKSINEHENAIFCIDFNKNLNLNASQLFRFLGKFELYFPKNNVIIYNLSTELFFGLTRVNKVLIEHNSTLPYWNPDVFLLVYSYIYPMYYSASLMSSGEIAQNRFYFTDALWGETYEQFDLINRLIKKTNFNAINYYPGKRTENKPFINENQSNKSIETAKIIPDSNLFLNSNSLIPFDLLIKASNKATVFENNARTLLSNQLIDFQSNDKLKFQPIEDISHQIASLPGFRISNSHYKVGSKIHINDFYYAKRFFQNSSYASRFALIVAYYIFDNQPINKISNLTLIGYGLYSELLVSLVATFLTKLILASNYKGEIKINHNLVNETDNISFIKGYENLNHNILIIVPIASTFSTSIKIEEFLFDHLVSVNPNDNNIKNNILYPHINIFVVSNGVLKTKNIERPSEIDGNWSNNLEWKYGWRFIDNEKMTISMIAYLKNSEKKREQKFFLSLPSKWHSIEQCDLCFPGTDNSCIQKLCSVCSDRLKESICPLAEKPLLGTDKTSVTPTLLFGFPKKREISNFEKRIRFRIENKAIKYGHSTRNDDHFHYYIYDEIFYEDNIEEISNWCKVIARALNWGNSLQAQKVLLFAPEHFSNTVFINTINEAVFSSSATILHYDILNNSISNFMTFYGSFINEFDKIYFVDDTIITGNTLFKANEFFRYAIDVNSTRKREYTFDGCFVLINRMTYFSQYKSKKILNKKPFFSFANIHLPTSKASDTKCQLCIDYDKAFQLFNESYLDRFKHHFSLRIKKLTKKEISSNILSKEERYEGPKYNKEQNLIKIETIHRLYDYFSDNKNINYFITNNLIFNEWQAHFLTYSKVPFIKSRIESSTIELFPLSNSTSVLLKVLSLHPFNLFNPIKQKIFYWTNYLLNEFIETNKNFDKGISHFNMRDLKFLLRRAGLLNSNFIISNRFLDFIISMLSYIEQHNVLEKTKLKISILEQEVTDIKELLIKDKQLNIESEQLTKKYDLVKNEISELRRFVMSIESFPTYFNAQIKELVFRDGSKSIQLERKISKLYITHFSTRSLARMFRMILEENGTLINDFWMSIKKELSEFEIEIENQLIKFKEATEAENLIKKTHYQYYELNSFLRIGNISEEVNFEFNQYIKIQTFLSKDLKARLNGQKNVLSSLKLHEKTQILCSNLEALMFNDSDKENSGSFLIVKYREGKQDKFDLKKTMFLAYKSGKGNNLIEENWFQGNNYITEFIDGIHNKKSFSNGDDDHFYTTIDVVERVDTGWESTYAEPNSDIKLDFLSSFDEMKYLLIMRFAENVIDAGNELNSSSQGVIVFYSDENIFDHIKTRYLLLLRPSITDFLGMHHKSDEFRDWFETEEHLKKTELLNKQLEILSQQNEKIRKVYESRFERFNHGAHRYFQLQESLFKNSPNDIERLYTLSQMIKSHVEVGLLFAKYLANHLQIVDSNYLVKTWDEAHVKDFKRIIDGLNSIYIESYSSFNIEFKSLKEGIESLVPYEVLKNFILELISNAMGGGTMYKYKILIYRNYNDLIIESQGRPVTETICEKLRKHINNEYPEDSDFGIGLFIINKYFCLLFKKCIEIKLINDLTFQVTLPLI